MVEVHLYGSLRRYAPDSRPNRESVARLEPRPGETVETTLGRLGISPAEVYHVFLNGALLSTGNSMAPWLRYQENSTCKGLNTPVQPGDRLGLFARDMGLLVI
ncbi:MAG: hypothetical protein SXV54_24735 [Chloroflexota bacterium]|nr:hypothetical protein [Chloroflexota bacterium]